MTKTAELIVELIEAAEYDIECIQAACTNDPAVRAIDGQLLRDLQNTYHDLIASLHLAITAVDSGKHGKAA